MIDEIEGFIASMKYISALLGRVGRRADTAAGHGSAIVREEQYRLDDDVAPGGQNFKGDDAKRGTV